MHSILEEDWSFNYKMKIKKNFWAEILLIQVQYTVLGLN